jgi:ribonuclease D
MTEIDETIITMNNHEVLDNQAFEALCDRWVTLDVLTLDTEFMRTRTFYPLLGLLQVSDGEQAYLIDPLIIDITPFKKILTSTSLVKVFHSCQEDIEILHYLLDCEINQVFDTQIAASFLDLGKSIGYGGLVLSCLGIELLKDETQSDWLKRPLTPKQLNYAAADVSYLFHVYHDLKARLETLGRLDWVFEDSEYRKEASFPSPHDQYYLKVRQGWNLKGQKLWLLQQLCAWREKLAREVDVPRGRILKDLQLMAIANEMPTTHGQIFRLKDIPTGFVKKHGQMMIDLSDQSRKVGRNEFPERITAPLPTALAGVFKQGKALVTTRAESLGVAVESLARRRQLERLFRSGMVSGEYELLPPFDGWRKEVISLDLIDLFKKYQS